MKKNASTLFNSSSQGYYQPKKLSIFRVIVSKHFIKLIGLCIFLISHGSIAELAIPGGNVGACPASTVATTCTLCGDVNKDGSVNQADVTALNNYIINKNLPDENVCNANVNLKEDGNYPVVDIGDVIKLQYDITNTITPNDCGTTASQDIWGPRLMSVSAVGPHQSCWYYSPASSHCNGGALGRAIAADVQGGSVLVRINADDNCGTVHGTVKRVKGTFTGGVEVIFTAESDTAFSYNVPYSLFLFSTVIELTKLEITDSAEITTIYTNNTAPEGSPLDDAAFTFLLPIIG